MKKGNVLPGVIIFLLLLLVISVINFPGGSEAYKIEQKLKDYECCQDSLDRYDWARSRAVYYFPGEWGCGIVWDEAIHMAVTPDTTFSIEINGIIVFSERPTDCCVHQEIIDIPYNFSKKMLVVDNEKATEFITQHNIKVVNELPSNQPVEIIDSDDFIEMIKKDEHSAIECKYEEIPFITVPNIDGKFESAKRLYCIIRQNYTIYTSEIKSVLSEKDVCQRFLVAAGTVKGDVNLGSGVDKFAQIDYSHKKCIREIKMS